MSKVTIIRHSQLEEPFDNYDKLNYTQLDELARGVIQPNISSHTIDLIVQSHHLDERYDVILHSPSLRAVDTAKLIAKVKELTDSDLVIKEIDEIKFSVSNLITEKEYKELGLQPLREKFYKAIGENQAGIESLESIYKRIQDFDGILTRFESKDILVVTHGFIMRYMKVYFEQKFHSKLPGEKVLQNLVENSNERYDYLSGFSVII